MAQFREGNRLTYPNNGALAGSRYLRVSNTNGTIALAGATTAEAGVLMAAVFATDPTLTVYTRTANGSSPFVASGAISAGVKVYADANGLVTAAAGGEPIGYSITSTTASGDVIEVVRGGTDSAAGTLSYTTVTDSTGGSAIASTQGTAAATLSNSGAVKVAVIPVPTMAGLAAGTLNFLPGCNGKIVALNFHVGPIAPTTGSKAATITAHVNGALVTGGVGTLTSANTATIGELVPSTPITALNTFTTAQPIGVVVSAVTSFVEGQGQIEIQYVDTDEEQNLSTILSQLNSLVTQLRAAGKIT